MYNDALKQFHIEIRQFQKGHLVFVTHGNGNPIRHPIKMADFEERSRFYLSTGKAETIGFANGYSINKFGNEIKNYHGNSILSVHLLKLIPSSSDKNNIRKKKLLMKKGKGDSRW